LLIELFDRAGYVVKFVDLPPRRALVNANNGLHDGDAARIRSSGEIYPNLRVLDPKIIDVDFVGLYLDPDVSVKTPVDFADYSVGYIRGWNVAENLFKAHPNAIAVNHTDSLLRMLNENRIDIAFLTREPGNYFADKFNMTDLKFTGFYIRRSLHLFLNIKHVGLLPKLEVLLTQMHDDGTYDLIMTDYLTR
tara:strand:- start:4105 stop:4680 length:576 start_codon:yes stop_codon:yes gene_type:complete